MNTERIQTFVSGLKSAQLVALYNLATPTAQVKKFSDRATAEKRLMKTMVGEKPAPESYETFFGDFAIEVAKLKLGFELPEPEAAPAPVEEKTKQRAPKGERTPQVTSPHKNLSCPTCKYQAKTTVEMLAKARLICPVDSKHGILKTAEERGRGAANG